METETIFRLLTNSGFRILGSDGASIYLEDPSCILRSFQTFAEYAWVIITCLTGVLIFGWAVSMIRGSKNDIFINLRNLTLIFGILSAAGPIINMIYGGDLFGRGCRTITVQISDINKLLKTRNLTMTARDQYNLYEELNIYDSGASYAESFVAPDATNSATQPELVDTTITTEIAVATPSQQQPPTASATHRDGATGASGAGRDVIYTHADGTRTRRTGGTRAWRNNNPGNIRYSEFSRRMGAVGSAGGFAVFPNEETGMRAITTLLRSNSYNRLTVAGAISRYAPPSENNTAGYHRRIEELTGLSINRKMSDLSDAELARVASAIRTVEGWRVGRTTQE